MRSDVEPPGSPGQRQLEHGIPAEASHHPAADVETHRRGAGGGKVLAQPAVLRQRELAARRLSRDAAERLGTELRDEIGDFVAVAVVMPSDHRRQRPLAGVGEDAGLPHAGDADCGDRLSRRCGGFAQRVSALHHRASASV